MAWRAVIAVGVVASMGAAPSKETVQETVKLVPAPVVKGKPRLYHLVGPSVLGPFKLAKGKQQILVRWKLKKEVHYYFMLQKKEDFLKHPGDLATTHQVIAVSGPADQIVDTNPVFDVGGTYEDRPLPPGEYYLGMGQGDAGCKWLVCLDKDCQKAQPKP